MNRDIAGVYLLNTAGIGLNVAATRLGAPPIPGGGAAGAAGAGGAAATGGRVAGFMGKVGKFLGPLGVAIGAGFEMKADYSKWSGRMDKDRNDEMVFQQINGMNVSREEKVKMLKQYQADGTMPGGMVRQPLPSREGEQKMGSTVAERRKQAMQFYAGRGYDTMDAAAIVGNLSHESKGLDPNAKYKDADGRHSADGLAQWRGPRKKAYKQRYGYDIDDPKIDANKKFWDQLDFVDYEASTTHAGAKKGLKSAKTLTEKNKVFEQGFEGSGSKDKNGNYQGHGMDNRLREAQKALSETQQPEQGRIMEVEPPPKEKAPEPQVQQEPKKDPNSDMMVEYLKRIAESLGVKPPISAPITVR